MTLQCVAPDPDLGVVLRISAYLDCQSRALGENGFQALAGGPAMTGILSGLVTIFVALIGYRMILGSIPGIRDGIGWAIRLGLVLALVTSWPAFQTLVYQVMVDGPQELSAIILPAASLPSGGVDARVQSAYDHIRLGSSGPDEVSASVGGASQTQALAVPAASQNVLPASASFVPGMAPMPGTASLLVVSTSGMTGALRLAVGFLLSIGPIAVLCLLFRPSVGMFEGWFRALVGAAFGVLAANVTTAIELVVVESEIAHAQAVKFGADAASTFDPQALVTIVQLFVVVGLAAVFAAARTASAFRLPSIGHASWGLGANPTARREGRTDNTAQMVRSNDMLASTGQRSRAMVVANALSAAAYREDAALGGGDVSEGTIRVMTVRQNNGASSAMPVVPLGVAGRRSSARRTQSARRRDLSA